MLEDARLLRAVLELVYPVDISVSLYFYVLVRHSLKEAGIDDVEVADYVAATLAEYAKGNPFARVGREPPVDFTYSVDFMSALDQASDYDRFLLHVHCGNQFLVLTGLFPRGFRRGGVSGAGPRRRGIMRGWRGIRFARRGRILWRTSSRCAGCIAGWRRLFRRRVGL